MPARIEERVPVRNIARLCLMGVFATTLLWSAGTSAQAAITHAYLRSITAVESTPSLHVAAPGLMGNVNSLTVDSGNLWVAEGRSPNSTFGAQSRIDEFNGEGTEVERQLNESEEAKAENLFSGVAVSHTSGKSLVYVGGQPNNQAAVGRLTIFEGEGADAPITTWSGEATAEKSFGTSITGVAA